MSEAVANIETAFERAVRVRPAIGGFPYLAEPLRQAGVTRRLATAFVSKPVSHRSWSGRSSGHATTLRGAWSSIADATAKNMPSAILL